MYKIFLVEDDPVISKAVLNSLAAWGYEVEYAKNFKEVIREFENFEPQLVLLDISLPFYNGYYWCSQIRRESNVPIMFLSGTSDNMNIVMAMNMGADDFLAKPFDLEVLNAKVGALLRRAYNMPAAAGELGCRGAILRKGDATLMYKDHRIELTKNEYRILEVLMENIGKIVSRAVLMDKLWETDSFIDDNTLTVNVTRLRRKLDEYGLSDFIRTKKGLGYIICESSQDTDGCASRQD